MRKVFILLLAVSLFASCKDKKVDRRDDRRSERDRDDYRSGDDNRDRNSKDADYTDDKNNDDRNSDRNNSDDRNSGGGWSSSEVKIFVDNCVSSAVNGGMQQSRAEDYCNCMQKVLEKDYPNANDVGNVDMNSSRMQAAVKDCLGM